LPFVLAYHGCDIETAHALLGGLPFHLSNNKYDWLGSGAYFWEADYVRAYEWAKEFKGEGNASVVGAVIELGNCLDLTTLRGAIAVKAAYEDFAAYMVELGEQLPKNKDLKDRRCGEMPLRYLDRAVITHLHGNMKAAGIEDYDTLRALFPEGDELYSGAGFWEKTHMQIAVRNTHRIYGVFRIPEHQLASESIPVTIYRPLSPTSRSSNASRSY
jgi:hypothetical protein